MNMASSVDGKNLYSEALECMQRADPDVCRATALLEQSFSLGDPFAAYALGTWYFFGTCGKPCDKNRAVELWLIAAKAKVPSALFDLANCYENGDGVEKNLELAFCLYLEAAIRGDEQAVFEVGRCYQFGIGIVQDEGMAEIWFARAEELQTFESDESPN